MSKKNSKPAQKYRQNTGHNNQVVGKTTTRVSQGVKVKQSQSKSHSTTHRDKSLISDFISHPDHAHSHDNMDDSLLLQQLLNDNSKKDRNTDQSTSNNTDNLWNSLTSASLKPLSKKALKKANKKQLNNTSSSSSADSSTTNEISETGTNKTSSDHAHSSDDQDMNSEDHEDMDMEEQLEMKAYLEIKKEEKKRRKSTPPSQSDSAQDPSDDSDSDEHEDLNISSSKTFVNDKASLLSRYQSIRLCPPPSASSSSHLPWTELQSITAPTSSQEPDSTSSTIDQEDDLKRELHFYTQALASVHLAFDELKAANVPITRPDDYYAEMIKSDEHMAKVRTKLLDEMNDVNEKEKARKLRDAKKVTLQDISGYYSLLVLKFID